MSLGTAREAGGGGGRGAFSDGAPGLLELGAHGEPGVSDAGRWTLLPGKKRWQSFHGFCCFFLHFYCCAVPCSALMGLHNGTFLDVMSLFVILWYRIDFFNLQVYGLKWVLDLIIRIMLGGLLILGSKEIFRDFVLRYLEQLCSPFFPDLQMILILFSMRHFSAPVSNLGLINAGIMIQWLK